MAEDLQALADAGRELEEHSGIGSASSEERDAMETGRRIQDELERRSNSSGSSHTRKYQSSGITPPPPPESDVQSDAGSCASLGTTNSVRAIYKAPATVPAEVASKLRGDVAASSSSSKGPLPTPIRDKVGLAVLEAKRAALEKVTVVEEPGKLGQPESGSGSHAGGGGSGSHVGSISGSAGSGSHPSHQGGGQSSTTFGLSQSSAVPPSKAATVAQAVLPSKVLQVLPADKLQEVENVMEVVVEKTGAELAEMQRALEKSKAKAAAEAREKAELEARLANIKVKAVAKDSLVEALSISREKAAEVQDQRDDLHDKLVGMETLINAKMERYQKDIEELREAGKKREDDLKKKAEQDKAKLVEELSAAAKEIEKSKKQKIAALSERDVIRRAEMLAQKQVQAEMQSLKAELAAANLGPRRGGNVDDLETAAGLVEGDSNEEQRSLQEKLRFQRDNNRKLSLEFERLRLDMLQAHQEKDDELADLRAKVEVSHAIPIGKIGQGKIKKKPGGKSKLSSIDEEEDEDMASQAGSGVSGQVSSDCDGVGDLRDFDDYDPKNDEVRRLREQLADAEAWYKHLNEIKNAKDTEHMAKIERLAAQMQAFREEAKMKKDEVERLKAVTEEIDAEKQAEVALVQSRLESVKAQTAVVDADRQRELEDKVNAYASQLLELKERLAIVVEEKRVNGLRLADTQHELEATEARYSKIVSDLKMQLNLAHGGTGQEAEETENDLLSRVNAMEEERNILRNELECQQVHWAAQLEDEQRQCAATLSKLKEEQSLAEKDRELKAQVEQSLKESQRMLVATRQALKEAEAKAAVEAEKAASLLAGQPSGPSVISWLRCPSRSQPSANDSANLNAPAQAQRETPSSQAMIWQILNTMGGVAALFCSDEAMTINDASKKAFAMWGSSSLRGGSLYSLVYDQAMASWLKTELAMPTTPAFLNGSNMPNFWVRELGCVEFRSRLGSAFDASVTCVRLPEEVQHGRAGAVLVIVEPVAEEQQQMRIRQQPSQNLNRLVHRRGPASTTSSVHSEDITANDSVSNVNAKW